MEQGRLIGGGIVLLLGVAFLLMNFGLLPSDVWKLWPIILIVIGASILLRSEKKK